MRDGSNGNIRNSILILKRFPLYEALFFDFSLENKLDKLPDNIYLRHYLQVIRSVYQPDKKKLARELIESFSIIKDEKHGL